MVLLFQLMSQQKLPHVLPMSHLMVLFLLLLLHPLLLQLLLSLLLWLLWILPLYTPAPSI
jgi:hypothetical protein